MRRRISSALFRQALVASIQKWPWILPQSSQQNAENNDFSELGVLCG